MVKAELAKLNSLKDELVKDKKARIKYPSVDWHTCLDMLIVELYIELGEYIKANDFLKNEIVKCYYPKFEREFTHWNAVIELKSGKGCWVPMQSLKSNKNYPPSSYLHGMECKK